MKKFSIILGTILFIGIMFVIGFVSISNKEIEIYQRGEAQQIACKGFYSNMLEIFRAKGAVAKEYEDAFAKIYPELIEGRYSQGDGSLMKWIQEQNPNFDTSLFKDLSVAIEAQRNAFFLEQTKLIDIDREHRTMLRRWPNNWLIGNRPQIGGEKGIVILQNLVTKQSYETGTDQAPDIFPKN